MVEIWISYPEPPLNKQTKAATPLACPSAREETGSGQPASMVSSRPGRDPGVPEEGKKEVESGCHQDAEGCVWS